MQEEQPAQPITVSEAYHLLEPLKERYRNTRTDSYQIYKKTMDYTETFCKIRDKSALLDLTNTLAEAGLSPSEISIVGTILPESIEEAKVCVPSLARLPETVIEGMIKKIQSMDL